MAGAVLLKLIGCISFYIARKREQPKYRICFVPFLGSAKRRHAPGGLLLIFSHTSDHFLISKCQLCQGEVHNRHCP